MVSLIKATISLEVHPGRGIGFRGLLQCGGLSH